MPIPFEVDAYSCRKASIGSSRDARYASTIPLINRTAPRKRVDAVRFPEQSSTNVAGFSKGVPVKSILSERRAQLGKVPKQPKIRRRVARLEPPSTIKHVCPRHFGIRWPPAEDA